ncbi:MAG: glycerate kinase [Solobacterium sp.]|nr:glycerate kinase [Solobacterium sp.]
MKLLFASDSFKGSLTSEQTVELLSKAAREVFGDIEYSGVPVSDGGEGTVDAVVKAENGTTISVEVYGPLMNKVRAQYGKLDENRAVIEMAAASGLPLIPREDRNPLNTTTFGTGELIRDALNRGFRDLSIAIGGSATNDGGMGCMRALGVKFLDASGYELQGNGSDLEKVVSIDVSGLDPRIQETKITVMCDVTNPLTGKDGATWTFGAQKGATPQMQERLEAGMVNYKNVIVKQFGIDPDEIKGSGAAGGLGTALMVFLHGEMRSGIETVLDLIKFDERLEGMDLCVTGEGRTDWQSCFGKVMQGVGEHAKAKGVTVLGLSGGLGKNAMDICNYGVASLMTTVNSPMDITEAIARAEELYYEGAVRMFRFVKAGMDLKKQ